MNEKELKHILDFANKQAEIMAHLVGRDNTRYDPTAIPSQYDSKKPKGIIQSFTDHPASMKDVLLCVTIPIILFVGLGILNKIYRWF